MEIKIDVNNVKLGMFVARLDRPWLGTPLCFQGFWVCNMEAIDKLRMYCSAVWVRTDKKGRPTEVEDPGEVDWRDRSVRSDREARLIDYLPHKPVQHVDTVLVEEELDAAHLVRRKLCEAPAELSDIGLGAMLIDIGKLKLPAELMTKVATLTDTEQALVRRHVEFGVELVREAPGINSRILEIVANHHERYDGNGYPGGLAFRKIPPFARMVSIADFFDAVTSDKPYASGISPHDAMRKLYDEGDKAFQRELVEQFIQSIGIYPTGTPVELSTGEVGVIVGQNRVRRLKPRLMLILDADKQPLKPFVELDLMELPGAQDGREAVSIRRSVEPEQFGIDPRQFYITAERTTPEILRNIALLM